jgi:tetratricopeptide (TPR) repeat protein
MAAGVDYAGSTRFQLVRRIGAGGMGIVYEAVDRERNDRVALKVLKIGGADAVLRFKNEFRQLEGVDHPNLVGMSELIAEDGRWLLAMELVEGDNFLSWVRPLGEGDVAHPHEDTELGLPTPGSGEPVAAGGVMRRVGPRLDVDRLRAALAQLVRGLAALHAHGMVHRDIKPTNILVTSAGRVVILDFGLVTMLGAGDAHVVGTTAYMAPEQAAQVTVGPEADWYSVGVLLYEALTGRLPFTGAPMRVLEAKQRSLPPRPAAIAAAVPEDLDDLCMRLLAIEPRERPGAGELVARLRIEATGVAPPASSTSMRRPPFVGRQEELAVLDGAFAASCRGQPRLLVVEGASGLGKSALVRAFLDGIADQVPHGVILAGRCYERESVPYKAVDGVIDALARWLGALPRSELEALLPEHVGMLARLFPVLVGIDPIAEAQGETIDPQELRIRGFSALRELLARIGDRRPLVVAIDDLQWADADSLSLLGEVLAPPCAPVMLFVGTARALDAGALPGAERLPLGPLPPPEAEELTRQLLQRAAGAVNADVLAIAGEAHGHPMFIDELVRHVAAEGSAPAALRLDDAITARVARLETTAQRVLEICALYGGPLAQEVVAKAAGCGLAELGRAARILGAANLARTSGARGTDGMEPYHDRVREAVTAGMAAAARTAAHLRLARALEASGRSDPEALAVHYRDGGEPERATEHAIAAAQHAAGAFAFDRAARFYAMALELSPEHPRARELRVAHADALAYAGRGAEAAVAYLAAVPGTSPAERLDLERRAAEQYLASGRIDEGLEVIANVLGQLGMSWPATPRKALLSMLARRARLRLRGLGFKPRDAGELPAAELTRIDVCYALASVVGTVDTVRGADFQTRHLMLALRAGEPYRVARALSVEAGFTACDGGRRLPRLRTVVNAMKAAAAMVDHPFITGLVAAEDGLTKFFLGQWRTCDRELRAAEDIFRTRCQGASYEIGICEFLRFNTLCWTGDLDILIRELPGAQRAAYERGDRLKQNNLQSSFLIYYWLAQDDVAGARVAADRAIAGWSQAGFHIQHANDLVAQSSIELYAGDAAAAHARLEGAWPELQRSLLLYIQQSLIELVHLRGRAALAVGDVRRAEKDARRIEKEDMAWGNPLAMLLRAGIAAQRGRRDQAEALLDRAIGALEAVDMLLHAAAARWQLGQRETAGEWMTGKGIREPEKFARLLVPGF